MDVYHSKIFRHIEIIKKSNKKVFFLVLENLNLDFWQNLLKPFIEAGDLLIFSGLEIDKLINEVDNFNCGAILVASKNFSDYIVAKNKISHLQKKRIIILNVIGYSAYPGKIQTSWGEEGISYPGMFEIAGRYSTSLLCAEKCYVEFGCFEGKTLSYAYHILKNYGITKFFAFDSFKGLLGTNTEESIFQDGQYFCSRESLEHNLIASGCDLSKIKITQVDIRNLLKQQANFPSIAVANIDLDIFEPTKKALDYITDYLVQGSLILFDDFDCMGSTNKAGERKALKIWLEENPDLALEPFRNYGTFGRAFIVHKK